jgi:hypothetical protein
MPAAALIFAPTAAGVGILSKRAKARREQAAANKWSTAFPLVDDTASMDAMIEKAKLQLKTLNAQKPKKPNKSYVEGVRQLSKWIGVMQAHRKDLKVGMSMASTNTQSAPTPAAIAQAPLPVGVAQTPSPVAPDASPAPLGEQAVAENMQNGDNLASDTKKPTNWLLIGGIVVGAIVLYKIVKR